MPCLWPSFLVCSSFLKKVSSIIPHFPSFILGNANAMQYILKAIITNVLAIFITLSLHFLWYLFGLIIPGKRCAMCLADRIKSATPSIGHKEVYLKRERGFFREFVSLGPREDNQWRRDNSVALSSRNSTESKARQSYQSGWLFWALDLYSLEFFRLRWALRSGILISLTGHYEDTLMYSWVVISNGRLYLRTMFSCISTPGGPACSTHIPRRPQCLRLSQDGFEWIQTAEVMWGAQQTHGRLSEGRLLGVPQPVQFVYRQQEGGGWVEQPCTTEQVRWVKEILRL